MVSQPDALRPEPVELDDPCRFEMAIIAQTPQAVRARQRVAEEIRYDQQGYGQRRGAAHAPICIERQRQGVAPDSGAGPTHSLRPRSGESRLSAPQVQRITSLLPSGCSRLAVRQLSPEPIRIEHLPQSRFSGPVPVSAGKLRGTSRRSRWLTREVNGS